MTFRHIDGHEELPLHECDGSAVCEYGATGLTALAEGPNAIAHWVAENPNLRIPNIVIGAFLTAHPELFLMSWDMPEVNR
jgi:hypothetical protein